MWKVLVCLCTCTSRSQARSCISRWRMLEPSAAGSLLHSQAEWTHRCVGLDTWSRKGVHECSGKRKGTLNPYVVAHCWPHDSLNGLHTRKHSCTPTGQCASQSLLFFQSAWLLAENKKINRNGHLESDTDWHWRSINHCRLINHDGWIWARCQLLCEYPQLAQIWLSHIQATLSDIWWGSLPGQPWSNIVYVQMCFNTTQFGEGFWVTDVSELQVSQCTRIHDSCVYFNWSTSMRSIQSQNASMWSSPATHEYNFDPCEFALCNGPSSSCLWVVTDLPRAPDQFEGAGARAAACSWLQSREHYPDWSNEDLDQPSAGWKANFHHGKLNQSHCVKERAQLFRCSNMMTCICCLQVVFKSFPTSS